MKKITLQANGQRHEFIGQIVGSLRDERNVPRDGCINRQVCHYVLYQKEDQSFLLYTDNRLVSGGIYERTLTPLESLHSIYSLLPEKWADRLVGQFLDQVVPA